ncbi:MAG: hypothetical protein LBP73_01030 [Clostridiales Family XIII bacterium]|jgi:hypothetical protein|nr:hypothetical protein [Clostridiales Family XIII bacterium]
MKRFRICILLTGICIVVVAGILMDGKFSNNSVLNDSKMQVENFGSDIQQLSAYSNFGDYENGILPRKILATTQGNSNYEFLELYLCDYEGIVMSELQPVSPQYMNFCYGILDLKFADLNNDHYVDFVVVALFATGAGPHGMVPRAFCQVYMQTSSNHFKVDECFTEQFNDFFLETYRPDYVEHFEKMNGNKNNGIGLVDDRAFGGVDAEGFAEP